MKPILEKYLTEEIDFDVNFIVSYYKQGKYVKSMPIFLKRTVKEAFQTACSALGLTASSLKENNKHSPYVFVYEGENDLLIINSINGDWKKE